MIHRTAGENQATSLVPLYNFHQCQRRLDISQTISTDGSPLNVARSQLELGTFGF